MAYKITQINDLIQDDEILTTFILIDDKGIMPEVRLEKTFVLNDNISKIMENDKIMSCLFYENQFLNGEASL